MTYDLWDVESGNIVNTYETEAEALAVVRELLRQNGDGYASALSLGYEDRGGRMGLVAEGAALAARARDVLRMDVAPVPATSTD